MKLIIRDSDGKKLGEVDEAFKATGISQSHIDSYVLEGYSLLEIAARLESPPHVMVEVVK